MGSIDCIRSWTNFEIHVIAADHPATKSSGRIISGVILPCNRRKMGHFECCARSRGPTYVLISEEKLYVAHFGKHTKYSSKSLSVSCFLSGGLAVLVLEVFDFSAILLEVFQRQDQNLGNFTYDPAATFNINSAASHLLSLLHVSRAHPLVQPRQNLRPPIAGPRLNPCV